MMRIYNPTTLVAEFLKRHPIRDNSDVTDPIEHTLWAINVWDARNMLDNLSVRDLASMLSRGIQPNTIRDWLESLYANLIYCMIDDGVIEDADQFFEKITEADDDLVNDMEIGDAVQMLVDAIKR